jgi:hypothetical protein
MHFDLSGKNGNDEQADKLIIMINPIARAVILYFIIIIYVFQIEKSVS